MKRTMLFLVALICLLVGCSENKSREEHKMRSLEAWQACLDNGGIPIQSWHTEYVLGDVDLGELLLAGHGISPQIFVLTTLLYGKMVIFPISTICLLSFSHTLANLRV